MTARCNDSIKFAVARATHSRAALLLHKSRVVGFASRLFRKQCKQLVTCFEAADVSTKQLRVYGAVCISGTGEDRTACSDLGCAFECLFGGAPLFNSLRQSPTVDASTRFIALFDSASLLFIGQFGSVVSCDGLCVVNASGLGLKWFEPHSRNEFSVVLAQADGRVPVWLTTGDVVVATLTRLSVGTAAADGSSLSAVAAQSGSLARGILVSGGGAVRVMYEVLDDDSTEVVLQLAVCGAVVDDAAGDSKWSARVLRRPLTVAGHECAAAGTHVKTLAVINGYKNGMAVSADEKWLVVGNYRGTLSVYSLPGGELVRSFGSSGSGPLSFSSLDRLCFAPNSNILVVDGCNMLLQEVTLEGDFVRSIDMEDERVLDQERYTRPAGGFDEAYAKMLSEVKSSNPFGVAVCDDVIAVGLTEGYDRRVVLLDFGTGAVMSRFGELGTGTGQLSKHCTGIRFSPDGSHVIVAEDVHFTGRLSVFTSAGVFVRCVGAGMLGGEGIMDVALSVTGEYVVADSRNHRVCVFSPDGSELLRSLGGVGTGDGHFDIPVALAAAGQHLYVMDQRKGRVQVFE